MSKTTADTNNRERDDERREFRRCAASLVRYMMRARTRCEPKCFSQEQLTKWQLHDRRLEHCHTHFLLQQAYATISEINESFIERCGSGGYRVEEDDPDTELKGLVASFVEHQYVLPEAIADCWKGKSVKWRQVACWADVDRIRELLDILPWWDDDPHDQAKTRCVIPNKPIVLPDNPGETPIVLGTRVPLISETAHDVLKVLLEAAPALMSLKRIEGKLAEKGKRKPDDLGRVLRDLALSHPNWRDVLILPGKGKRSGYGVRTNFQEAT